MDLAQPERLSCPSTCFGYHLKELTKLTRREHCIILSVEGLNEGGYFTTMLIEMILLSGSALFYQTHQRLAMLGRLFPITFIFFFEPVQRL
jgi:hypothetical protein